MFIKEEGPIKMLILDHRREGGGCLHDNKTKKIFVKLWKSFYNRKIPERLFRIDLDLIKWNWLRSKMQQLKTLGKIAKSASWHCFGYCEVFLYLICEKVFLEEGGVTQCWSNIKRRSQPIIMHDYEEEVVKIS